MATVDLVKAASERSYIKFEDMALKALQEKVQENPVMNEFLNKLNVAQNIDEAGASKEDLAKEYNVSVAEVSKIWSKAAGMAKAEGKGSNFAYVIGIVRGMLEK